LERLKALLVNDASLAGHHGSALVTRRLVELAARAGIDVSEKWSWRAVGDMLEAPVLPFDIVIVNGEGSVHHNAPAARRIADLSRVLRKRRLPAYLINASEEANGPDVLEGLASFRLCFVRDSTSQKRLAGAGALVRVVPDLSLTHSWPRSRSAGGRLLVTDSSEHHKCARLVALAARWPGAQMVTFRAPPPWPVRGSPMRRVGFEAKRLAAKLAPPSPWSVRYAGAQRTHDEIVGLISSASGILCARYHAVCFALCLRVPFLAIEGNTGKIGALLADVGLRNRCVDLDSLNELSNPPAIPPFSPQEEAVIEDFCNRATLAAQDMFRTIAADARGRYWRSEHRTQRAMLQPA
jgi:hypothetical protein